VKALAVRRRSRLAPLVLVALALLVTGGAYSAVTSSPASATAATEDQIALGEQLFLANCATCHGVNAAGTDVAPSLIGVGAAAVDFQVSTGRMPMSANSAQAEAKPPQLDSEQIAALAAYVASLGAGPSIPTDEMVDPSLGNAANGMELFRTNCGQCHNAVGAGGALSEGKFAPPLTNTDPRYVYEAMLTGPQSMPVFNDANITPEEKRDIIAYLAAQDENKSSLFDLSGLGPVAEGVWVWIVGMGLLIGAAVWVGAKSS
jgi:ubiquinol-cytochrome c reductase cytochrome c subunit